MEMSEQGEEMGGGKSYGSHGEEVDRVAHGGEESGISLAG